MKRIGYIFITFMEVLFLAGAYIISYFTRKKMGMARYVVYKNQGWEQRFPMGTLKYTSIAVLIALTLLLFAAFMIQRSQYGRMVTAMHVTMGSLTVLYVGYVCFYSSQTMRAYYFISLMLFSAGLFQIIKTGAALVMCRKKKDE